MAHMDPRPETNVLTVPPDQQFANRAYYSQLEADTDAYWRRVEEDAATALTFAANLEKWKRSMSRYVSPGTGESCFFGITEAAIDAAIAFQMDDTKAMQSEDRSYDFPEVTRARFPPSPPSSPSTPSVPPVPPSPPLSPPDRVPHPPGTRPPSQGYGPRFDGLAAPAIEPPCGFAGLKGSVDYADTPPPTGEFMDIWRSFGEQAEMLSTRMNMCMSGIQIFQGPSTLSVPDGFDLREWSASPKLVAEHNRRCRFENVGPAIASQNERAPTERCADFLLQALTQVMCFRRDRYKSNTAI